MVIDPVGAPCAGGQRNSGLTRPGTRPKARPLTGAGKRIVLRFLNSPVEVLGDDRVRGLRVARNELVYSDGERLEARPTADTEHVECGLVLKSVGYRGAAIPSLPFDDARGTFPNDRGRVVDQAGGAPVPGVYAAGWIKRGPSGVIGTNKKCAEETVHALLDDFAAGRLKEPAYGRDALRDLIADRQPQAIDYAGWQAIDLHECAKAQESQRPRIKLTDLSAMLKIAEEARPAGG
ncbi:MAG TPA: hypothetical protein VJT49_20730 [Amycolatopsis sp.]|uniref:hypothetical protein n=1 Tax=Amycolatopsis sp. TaxID=37632 RepID=UPI002B48E5FD|nr:hypothetical protein [Amycolatopsis sp.]HKS47487.1 hypothetical protein [Amycolatopsis sp.]